MQEDEVVDSSKAAERETDSGLAPKTKESQGPFVVGLGASAGGLEALQDFMSNVPADSGVAYVVVTHQHKGHTSMMAELLGKHAKIPVTEIESSTELSPNQAYVGKPGIPMAILGGTLQLMPHDADAPRQMPIDYLFRSLAQDRGSRAIGIVLSGTGSDGSLGLKAIKGASGLTLAQSEDSARYPAMPRSAVATGAVDLVLPASDMPAALLRLVDDVGGRRSREEVSEAQFTDDLRRIIILLRHRTNHDFSNYKKSTIRRRIQRRMTLHGLDRIGDYVRFLQANQVEIDVLFRELLINVTSFFRDPEAFRVLAKRVLPDIVAGKGDDEFVRVWIPGCSTGEEAYSIAILLREAMDAVKRHIRVQIFATDLDVEAVDRARIGRYPEGIAQDVTKERLDRFFTFGDDHYKVNKEVREMVIFAQQNLLQDPPFTKLDLLSCRNLLIYLDSGLQVRRVLPLFHYSLKPGGILFLGSSESVGSDNPLFKPVDKRWKMFRRNEVPVNSYTTGFSSAPSLNPSRVDDSGSGAGGGVSVSPDSRGDQLGTTNTVLLEELVPPTVVCNRQGEMLHIHGSTGAFLELVPGPQKGNNLFTMAREGLRLDLASAVRQASGTAEDVVHRGVEFSSGGDPLVTDIQVRRLRRPEPFEGLYLVSFQHPRAASVDAQPPADMPDEKGKSRASELLRELQHTQEVHQGTVEELQTTNEELKSTNEELQSTNEELQSSNEELETSKEEMQSLNEELHTVNSELRMKLAELARVNDDMRNLLNGTDIATIFVDNDLCIKRYTEQVKRVANLIPGDIGRPLGDLVSKLAYPDLISHAQEVLKTLVFREVEVQGPEGSWFQVRLVPYRTTDNIIDGLVMTFVDITKIKRLLEKERDMRLLLKSSPVAVFGNDVELRYLWSGSAGILGHDPTAIVGKRDDEFLSKQNSLALQGLKARALKDGESVREVVMLESNGASGPYDFLAQPMLDSAGKVLGVAGVLSSKLENEP
jgi:two-component system CheB/CheR fusion protein